MSNTMDMMDLQNAAEEKFKITLTADVADTIFTPEKLISAIENELALLPQ